MADSTNSTSHTPSSVEDNTPGYSAPQHTDHSGAPGPNKGQLGENRRQIQEQAQQQEALKNGAGFQFDADELRHLKKEWQDLAEELNEISKQARFLGSADPPAQDDASTAQIKAVYQHARICADIHEQMYNYATEYSKRLNDALAKLENSDTTAKNSVDGLAKDV